MGPGIGGPRGTGHDIARPLGGVRGARWPGGPGCRRAPSGPRRRTVGARRRRWDVDPAGPIEGARSGRNGVAGLRVRWRRARPGVAGRVRASGGSDRSTECGRRAAQIDVPAQDQEGQDAGDQAAAHAGPRPGLVAVVTHTGDASSGRETGSMPGITAADHIDNRGPRGRGAGVGIGVSATVAVVAGASLPSTTCRDRGAPLPHSVRSGRWAARPPASSRPCRRDRRPRATRTPRLEIR